MAEATTDDLLKVQKETNKKVTFIGNVLNKNIVPASQQKERDTEANAFKQKLLEGMMSLKDSLKNMAKRTAQVAGFPFAIILGAIAFLIGFFSQIGKELAKLKKVIPAIKNIGKIVGGFFSAIRNGLVMAREAVVAKIAGALKAFKGTEGFKMIGRGLDDLADVYRLARESVVLKLKNALAAFKENAVVKAIGGAFIRMRNLLNLAKLEVIGYFKAGFAAFKESAIVKGIGGAFTSMRNWLNLGKLHVIELFKTGLAAFKENAVVKAIAGAFKTIAGFFGQAIGAGKGATGGIIGSIKAGMAAFRESAVFKSFAGIGKVLAGAFSGVLSLIGGAAKAAAVPGGAGAKVATGIVGTISKVFGAVSTAVKAVGSFTGLTKIITFAKGFGAVLGKLLWPITIIIGIFDFIKGFRKDKGWEGEDASIFTKIGMGISEALQGLIGLPLDMIKNVIAWILGKFGIGKSIDPETGQEVESGWMTAMKEFSFSDLIDKMIAGLWAGMQAVIDWVVLLFKDPVGAIVKLASAYVDFFLGIGTWLYNNTIKPIVDWVKGIFGFGEKDKTTAEGEDKGFSLSGLLFKALDGIKTWLGNMFKFDSAGELFATAFNVLTFLPNLVFKGLQLISKWLLSLFGFDSAAEKVANADNWTIGGMIVKAFKAVKDWIVGLFSWGTTDETTAEGEGGFSLTSIISGVFTSIKEWFGKLFKFDSASDTVKSIANVLLFIPNILMTLIGNVTTWLLSLFGFDDAAKKVANAGKFSIGDLLFKAIEGIAEWFRDLFDIDWGALMDDLVPNWAKKILPGFGGKSKEEKQQTAKADVAVQATQAAAAQGGEQFQSAQAKNYEARNKEMAGATDVQRADVVAGMGAFERDYGDDTFDRDRISELVISGMITKEDLEAILRETSKVDLSKIDRRYMNQMLDLIKSREKRENEASEAQIDMAEAATTSKPGSSLFVYDKHVEKTLKELIQPMIGLAVAQTQLLAAYGGGSGGSSTTVNNVTVSPSTSNTVSSVQKSENTYGTVDPYTSAAGAYG